MDASNRCVALVRQRGDLAAEVSEALEGAGILGRVTDDTRIALKPNFSYPYYKPGVTTSPAVIRETVRLLRQRTSHVAVVETDGGYGAWAAVEAFRGHGIFDLQSEFGIEVVNLCAEESELIEFESRGRLLRLPLPSRLLHQTDLLISMPVPKIHCMTGLSLSYKNQWGCIPDTMRLRRHYVFDDAIVAINRALKPAVLGDGGYFLDKNGPMEGDAIRMGLLIAATDAGTFDRYVSELMDFSWKRVPHLRRAVVVGDMPRTLDTIQVNIAPSAARTRSFTLQRTPRNWIALAAFRSRWITWFGYESWFGRVVLHAILYLLVGKPVKERPVRTPIRDPATAGS